MFSKAKTIKIYLVTVLALGLVTSTSYAAHSWNNYHWARTGNPFALKLGDNVSVAWDAYLAEASTDWSQSVVLDTGISAGGTNPKNCKPVSGRVEVCGSKYGFNGWLGVASVWVNGDHITQGTVKVNDSYFNTKTYNTPAWRRLVMCQEVGHTLGLDHQDEVFTNPNLGTCMDYTNNPLGPPSNEHLNLHDYEQLEWIYAHLDSITTANQSSASSANNNFSAQNLGRRLRETAKGKTSLYELDLGNDARLLTFVLWAE